MDANRNGINYRRVKSEMDKIVKHPIPHPCALEQATKGYERLEAELPSSSRCILDLGATGTGLGIGKNGYNQLERGIEQLTAGGRMER